MLLLAAGVEGGLVLLWIGLGWVMGVTPPDQGKASPHGIALGAAAVLPLLPLLYWLTRSSLTPLREMMVVVEGILVPYLANLTVTDFVLISLLAGVGEEGLFRGLLQGGLARVVPEGAALLLSAAVFGLLHMVTPAYAVLAGALGLYLGWLYASTDNIVVPMTVHALYDLAALTYLVKVRGRGKARI